MTARPPWVRADAFVGFESGADRLAVVWRDAVALGVWTLERRNAAGTLTHSCVVGSFARGEPERNPRKWARMFADVEAVRESWDRWEGAPLGPRPIAPAPVPDPP